MSKSNNLVEIAKILIEMKEERELNGIASSVLSRYPEGSKGIIINEDKFIVLNDAEESVVKENEKINTLKESNLKYNPNFYFGTHESDEPDIIDETHNKSKLINEAYTEVSFLPKDIYSEAEFNSLEGKAAVRSIIDKGILNPKDFDDYRVEKTNSYYGNVYDEIYRCRCIFTDISGNESVESLLIKAFKVSNQKGSEYSYKIINNENIKEQVDELENKVSEDNTGEMRAVYSKISDEEYRTIEKHIHEGIEQYYLENSKKFYRLTRVDIKAIYCLRLKKNPITISLLVDNIIKADLHTYYSMVAGSFNVFTCPNCKTMSEGENSYNGMKIHIDHDFINSETNLMNLRSPIGCTNCMERCPKCGAWHFKFSEYKNVINKGFYPISSRKFLKNYTDKDLKTEDFCSCKEYISWIYDDMGITYRNGIENCEKIIDKFLTSSCKLVFINYLTGEVIADYKDYISFLYEYLLCNLKNQPSILKLFLDKNKKETDFSKKKAQICSFVDLYKIDYDNEFGDFKLNEYIKESIKEFKTGLGHAFKISNSFIKATSLNQTIECNCCGGLYYKDKNAEGEIYFSKIKNLCACCSEATSAGYRLWNRADDGVVFYKPKNNQKAIRTYQSKKGEVYYDKWLKSVLDDMIAKISSVRS